MIEFKGDCGHIIRARDEDAGKVVRCTYCGREAAVVESNAGDDSAVFDEVEKTGAYDAQATRSSRKSAKTRKRSEERLAAGKPAKQDLDPFAVAMKMIYVAVIVIAVAVAWKYGAEAYHTIAGQIAKERSEAPSPSPATEEKPVAVARRTVGLTGVPLNAQQSGAYVASVPEGARIYHMPKWNVGETLFTDALADKGMQTNTTLRLAEGKHTIAVAMRINNADMMHLPGYPDLRRQIEAEEYDDEKLMEGFFVPDGSVGLRLIRVRGAIHLVRIYEIEVDPHSWQAVTAMFIPRVPLGEVMDFFPHEIRYTFDTGSVLEELEYYGVPEAAQSDIILALQKVGKVCYRKDEDSPYRLFQIDLIDGMLTTDSLGY